MHLELRAIEKKKFIFALCGSVFYHNCSGIAIKSLSLLQCSRIEKKRVMRNPWLPSQSLKMEIINITRTKSMISFLFLYDCRLVEW